MAIADVSDHSIAELVSLKGRNAIVTGGATGLGKAMVRRLAQAGANVVIADIDLDLDLAQETASLFQPTVEGRILTFRVDAANSASVCAAIDFTLEEVGGIDILVNNAALYPSIPVLETSDEEWDKVMAVNLRGLFVGSREVSREMIKAGKGGIIINVSSQAGFRGVSPGLAAYVASKHGVRGLTRQMAIELAPHGIRVLGIAPSHVRRQNIWHNSRRKLAECGPRPGDDIKRRSCGAASADVRWSSV